MQESHGEILLSVLLLWKKDVWLLCFIIYRLRGFGGFCWVVFFFTGSTLQWVSLILTLGKILKKSFKFWIDGTLLHATFSCSPASGIVYACVFMKRQSMSHIDPCGRQNIGECLCFYTCSWLQILIFMVGEVPTGTCIDGSVCLIN